jgi:sulfur transfer complex TusBCD TusB component (DsrH family)
VRHIFYELMQKLLYIVSKAGSLSCGLIPSESSPDREVSVLLIQDGVSLTQVPGTRVFALSEDAASRRVTPIYPTVSYQEMLRLLFEADTVVSL